MTSAPSQKAPGIVHSLSIDPPATRGTSPNLVATPHGVLLTWLEPIDEARTSHRLLLSKLVDNAWRTPTTITEGPSIVANWADVPSVAAQDDGTLIAHWAEKTKSPVPHAYDVVLARSNDGGTTWQRLGIPHRDGTAAEHGFVSLLPDGDAVLAVWLDGRASANGGGGPTMLRAARIGETIGPEQVIEDRVCDCCSTSAALTGAGPAVVYRDRDDGELRDPWIVRRTAGRWSAPSPVHHDGWHIAGCPVNGPMVVAKDHEVVTAWYTYADQHAGVRVAFSRDDGVTFDPPIEVDEPFGKRAPIGRVDLVIDRPGEALVAWMASEGDTGQLLVRRIARDGRRGPELAIAPVAAAREGGFPRMEAVGEDIVVAWSDPKTRNVRAARLKRGDVPAVAAETRIATHQVPDQLALGSPAPEYRAKRLDGTGTTFAALRGHPFLVNVWATWCEPCRQELPLLGAVRRRNLDRGLRVIALSVDREAPPDKIGSLARRFAPDLEVWHDPEDRVSSMVGVSMVPTTLLFDSAGVLRWRHEGAIADVDQGLASAIEGVLGN